MTINELRDKRNKLMHDAQAVLLQDSVDAEQRTKANKMLEDVAVIEGDIKALETIETRQVEERNRTKPARSNPSGNAEVEGNDREKRYKAAFSEFITRGVNRMSAENVEVLRSGEKRDVLTSNSGDAYLIPQQFYTTLIEAQKYVGGILNVVTKKVTNNNGAPMKFATVNDTANTLVTMTEGASLSDTDPTFSGFLVSTDTIATLVKVSIQELADSYFNLDSWIKNSFGVRYARGLDAYIVNGNSSNVASISAGAAAGATASGTSSTTGANLASGSVGPVFGDFAHTYGVQDAAYIPNSKWAMNQATRAYLMGQTDNYGRPLFIVSPNSGTLDQILGCPVVITPNLPNAVNTSTSLTSVGVLFGDFAAGYCLRTDGPLSIVRLDERYLDALEIGFIGYSRIGGAVTNAGTNPIIKLTTPVA